MIKKVQGTRSLKGSIAPPPDKSISQRAAIFSLLHDGVSVLEHYSAAEDPQSTLKCVELLGAEVRTEGDAVTVLGVGRDQMNPFVEEIDCGNSGTAMRLLGGVIAGAGLNIRMTGDPSLSRRTMKRIIDPLESMGAHILARNGEYAPLNITRKDPFTAIEFELPIPSAQLKSCILLAGLFGEEPTTVIETIASRDHTERMLGLKTEILNGKRYIYSSRSVEIPNQTCYIPADFSAAAFWLVAGSIIPESRLTLSSVGLNPTRTALLEVLEQMGADIEVEDADDEAIEPTGDLIVKSSELKAIELDEKLIPNCIDEIPVIAVAMACAKGVSTISGAEELRHKETDRITAVAEMLKQAGVKFEEKSDGLIIHGDPEFIFEQAEFRSFKDHRIAMASAVLSLRGKAASSVLDAESAAVSYPGFWDDLERVSQHEA